MVRSVSDIKVLVACEYSGTVRDEFSKLGFDTTSCDILPTESEGKHYQGDVRDILCNNWDLVIGHPPCTYLAVSGARWMYHPEDKNLPVGERRRHPKYPNRLEDQESALGFFKLLYNCPSRHVALENPVSVLSSKFRKPDQVIQPYQFGDPATKTTCLWTRGLPKLTSTNIVSPQTIITSTGRTYDKWWYDTCKLPTKNGERAHARNKTFKGIAEAMATQWGEYLCCYYGV